MRRLDGVFGSFVVVLLVGTYAGSSAAQQSAPTAQASEPQSPPRPFTIDTIYSPPGLNGHLTRGIAWTPDSKQFSFFKDALPSRLREGRTELWITEIASGKSRVLVSAEKLEAMLPEDEERPTQATGLGRRAPAEYQWAPSGTALVFRGPTALGWFDLKTQTARTLVSGQAGIADPKISPDGKYVSFVREHNLWLVSVADGRDRAVTQGGTEEVRKGELDWVYPEELEITTAYWWAPDSSAIAFLEMDERKVARYPLVAFSSPSGEAEEERYPPAGGANPVVHVFVAPVGGGEARVIDTGANADIYIARVDWLGGLKHFAIQPLNRPQNQLRLFVARNAKVG